MLRPTRPVPRPGVPARVGHFGGGWERAIVTAVDEDGRRVVVACDSGELVEFVLSRATGKFVASAGPGGPRLDLLAG